MRVVWIWLCFFAVPTLPLRAEFLQAPPVQAAPVQVAPMQAAPMQAAPEQAGPLAVTMLLAFSEKNAPAYAQQMQHWQILAQLAGAQLAVRYEYVSLQRSMELVQHSGYCTLNKLKTPERQAAMLFSQIPLNISPSLRLIRPGLNSLPADVDLLSFLKAAPRLKIGVASGSSHGAVLDAVLVARAPQVYALAGEDAHLKLWQMLKKGRIDALLDYGVRIEHLRRLQGDALPYSVASLQGQPKVLEGFLVCNRAAHGQQAIRLFDQLMQQPAVQQALYHSYQQYFQPAEWLELQPYFHQWFSQLP